MATTLKPNERLVHVATCGERAPDGTYIRSVKLYEIVSEEEVCPETGLTEGEKKACEGILSTMAAHFGKYVDEMEALELRRRKEAKHA